MFIICFQNHSENVLDNEMLSSIAGKENKWIRQLYVWITVGELFCEYERVNSLGLSVEKKNNVFYRTSLMSKILGSDFTLGHT